MATTLDEAKAKFADATVDLIKAMQPGDAPPPGPDPNPEPDPKPSFKIFENIRYRNGPDLRSIGMEPLKIHYEAAFFSDRQPQGAYQDLRSGQDYPLPDLSRVAAVARSSPAVSCVDIERYWNNWQKNGDEEIDPRAIDTYETICTAYDDALPRGHQYGLYSTLPLRSYWPVINNSMGRWRDTNTDMMAVGDLVDMTFPSIYTFYTDSDQDQNRWIIYAIEQIKEAKRIAPGKPCYPFLWPTFHSGNDAFKGKPVPPAYFRKQLDTCRKYADGVVIWTLSRNKNIDFRDIPPWWVELKDFAQREAG